MAHGHVFIPRCRPPVTHCIHISCQFTRESVGRHVTLQQTTISESLPLAKPVTQHTSHTILSIHVDVNRAVIYSYHLHGDACLSPWRSQIWRQYLIIYKYIMTRYQYLFQITTEINTLSIYNLTLYVFGSTMIHK